MSCFYTSKRSLHQPRASYFNLYGREFALESLPVSHFLIATGTRAHIVLVSGKVRAGPLHFPQWGSD